MNEYKGTNATGAVDRTICTAICAAIGATTAATNRPSLPARSVAVCSVVVPT